MEPPTNKAGEHLRFVGSERSVRQSIVMVLALKRVL
jgi:hypothetical protein